MLIDTHCHLYKEYYDDLDKIIIDMKKDNIFAISNGCDAVSNEETLNLSKRYDNIYAAIGYHPTEIKNISKDYIEKLKLNKQNIVAIGEIGLDYYWNKDNKKMQQEIFERQLAFAEENDLPVIVHSRDATMDTYNILKKYKLKGVIHAFSGSYEMAVNYINLGYKLGIGGVITFKNSNLKEIVKKISLENIVLETDSPYLSPEPNRGKINIPSNIRYIAQYIADLKKISYEKVCNVTSKAAVDLFDLDI